ncbi:MAG: cytochrome c [Rhizobiaceae bacterium]
MRTVELLVALFTVTAGLLAAASAEGADVARGQALVEANCGSCHALGETGASLHPQAPPFRDVFVRYPPDLLAEALAEGISTGHPDMPEFVAEPDEIADIIAYLETLVR